jgi:hypothetical protein
MQASVHSISAGSVAEYEVPAGQRPARLGKGPANPLVQSVDHGELAVGLLPGAEEDRLVDLRGSGEPREWGLGGVGGGHRARVRERVGRSHQKSALAVVEAHGALAVHPAKDRLSAGEITVAAASAPAAVTGAM